MFGSIVVGTDGSDTAKEAVTQAADLAKSIGATVHLVSAYEPIPEARLRQERKDIPEDLSHLVNPRSDVEAKLGEAAEVVGGKEVKVDTHAREGDPADAILDVAEEEKGEAKDQLARAEERADAKADEVADLERGT